MSEVATWSLGIDMGGTYVDVVACDSAGRSVSAKQPHGALGPAASALAAIDAVLREHGIAASAVARIVHGSTIVTNLLLETRAAPVAVLTTPGYEDVLTLGRQNRRDLYTPIIVPQRPGHVFPRELRTGIGGRMDAQGRELEALDEAALHALAEAVHENVQAVAICFINAHANGAHERRARDVLHERAPHLHVSISSEVDARPREFERFLATALDAYAKPVTAAYLEEFTHGLTARGLPAPEVMRADCGTATWREAVERPLRMAMSGPAAALAGVAQAGARETLVALDIGGTTSDIGLVEAGLPATAHALQIGDFDLRMRCADVTSVAVGGGSLAHVVAGAGLRVGPQSQGAQPGPAAYGRGGKRATVSDALVLLGRLPQTLAGGLSLRADLAQDSLVALTGEPGSGAEARKTAQAVIDIAATAIAEGLKSHLYTRGVAPADCVLVAGGGGGAQHAAEVAELAGISRVRVLPQAGVIAAQGLLASAPMHSEECALDSALDADLDMQVLAARARDLCPSAWRDAMPRWRVEAIYAGQDAPIEIDYQPDDDDAATLIRRFDERHRQLRGHAGEGRRRLRRLRLELTRAVPMAPKAEAAQQAWPDSPLQGQGPRALFFPKTTVWVPRGWSWTISADASLWLTRIVVADEATRQATREAATEAAASSADPMRLEPLRLSLQGIVDRMQHGMMQGAHSSIAREGGDCAAALFLPDGQLLAQARSLPLLLGALIPAVEHVLKRFPVTGMRAGEGYLLNDPWAGGSHLPDLTLVRPVFHAGRVIALAATSLHHQDVGGIAPGSIPPNATEIFQEGLRLPPLRSHVDGELDTNIETILRANTRASEMLFGDLGAQWAACALGAREAESLVARHGSAFEPAAQGLIDLAERMTRAALAQAPDGRYTWSDALDGDGVSTAPVPIVVALEKKGELLTIDFTGSAPQTRGPVNAAPAAMLAAALFFMRSLAPEAPNNAGSLRPLRFVLPPGSVVNPNWPAAVNARTATVKLACNAILSAWSLAGGADAMGANAGVATVVAVGGERADGRRYFYTEIIASGAGASAQCVGQSGISTDVGNARNTPAEVLEADAPLLLERYEIRAGSGGAGAQQGGDGVRRVYRLLEGQARLSYRGERHATQAQGAQGGSAGASSRAWIERADGTRDALGARAQVTWFAGDRLVIETAGAGGWGDPATGRATA